MKTLETGKLKEYVKKLVELEKSVYEQDKCYTSARGQLKKRTINAKTIKAPDKSKYTVSIPKEPRTHRVMNKTGPIVAIIVGLILSLIFILWLISRYTNPTRGYDYLRDYLWIFTIAVSGLPVVGVFLLIKFRQIDKKNAVHNVEIITRYEQEKESAINKQKEADAKYLKAMEEYRTQRIEADEQYKSDLEREENLYNEGKKAVDGMAYSLSETKNVLDQYYALDVVFPKYRNLIALSSFLEYLETGRCTELEGPNGCYNLFESELRQNIIIGQLSSIVNQLEQVKQNQFILYQELQEANATIKEMDRKTARIMDYTQQTAVNSAISAYCAEVTAQNTAMTNAMIMFG